MVKLKTIYDLEKINYNLNLINTTNYLKSNNDFQLPIINEEVFKYLILNNVKIGYTSIVLQIYEENNNFLIRTWPSIPTVPASSATLWPGWREPMPPA